MQVNTMALLGLQSKEDVGTYGRQALQDAIAASAMLVDRVNSGAEVRQMMLMHAKRSTQIDNLRSGESLSSRSPDLRLTDYRRQLLCA